MLFRTKDELEEIIDICKDYNVEVAESMYRRKPTEVEEIIKTCQECGMKVTGSCFRKNLGGNVRNSKAGSFKFYKQRK